MDTTLKQRLIGAIVLVALAVIFLPLLVKGPAPDSGVGNVPIEAPEAPAEGQMQTRELPLVVPAQAPQGGAVGMPAATAPDSGVASAQDDGAAATGPAVAAGNYAVTFGAYASQADADAVIAHLGKSSLPGFSEAATINGRQAWRVRVGPYAQRADAESARLQATKIRSDVKAEVITLDASTPATAAVPAATPTTPAPTTPAPAPSSTSSAATASAPARSEPLPPAPKPTPAKPETPAATKPVAAAPKPETKPEAKPATKPAVAAPAAPAASGVGFAVQLGAFGSAADANALRDKVRAAGFSAFVEQVRTDKGTLSRVRVGPVASRADAEQLRAQVAARVGIAGMVRPHP